MALHPQARRRRRPQHATLIVVGGGRVLTETISRQLGNQSSYEVLLAQLPGEVLRQLTVRNVPLVVCDDTAPCMRSFQLMSEIKACSPETRVVLVVPGGSIEQEQRARAAGADEYLAQPFALKRLRGIVAEVFA